MRALKLRSLIRAGLALCALGPGAPAFALDPGRALTQYVQNVWRVEEGLPHNSVRAITQTKDGYLWLGTYGGLARFDGVRFEVFDNRNSVLTNNEIRVLHEDARGVLWVGTTSGGLYRLEKGELHKDGASIQSQTINAVLSTRDGSLLVGAGNGLYRITKGTTTRLTTEQGLWANTVNALVEAPDGRVWIGTENGVNVLQGGVLAKGPQPIDNQKAVLALLLDRQSNLYVGGRTLERFDSSGRRTLSIPTTTEGVFALSEDRDGNIWVGLYGAGIARLEHDTLKAFGQAQGFLDRRAWSIASDRDGGLWVGTRGGVAQLRDGAAISYSSAEGFAGDIARAVFEDHDGALYFGYAGGVSRFAFGRVENLTASDGLPSEPVRGLLRDRKGRLWIGTEGGLAEQIGPRRFRVHGEKEGLPPRPKFPYEDRSGRLWIGTNSGIVRFEDGKGSMPMAALPLKKMIVEALYEDRAGWLWIGTQNQGAWRLKNEVLEQVPLLGLSSIGVRSFYEDHDGVLFVGTIGSGLFVQSPGQPFRQITTREGLVDDSIWSILDDGQGQMWMTSDRGVFRVARSELLAFANGTTAMVRPNATVGPANGLKSRECNGGGNPSGLITKDGRVIVPTGAGVAVIDPRLLIANVAPPPTEIEEIVVDRVTLPPAEPARVPPGARDTEIHYTGLSFLSPAQLQFRYRLDGHDPEWVVAGTRRVAYYGGLSPGTYVFRVAASNDGVEWSGEEATINLTVEPRWHQRWIFRAGALILLAGLVASGFALRLRHLEGRELELTALVASRTQELAQRTRDLEAANLSLGQLAITDDLTGIANHRQFRQFIENEWLRCLRTQQPISLLMCDIDDFKAYNDALGHQAGDQCLREVGGVLSLSVRRAPDLAARYGGEEFAVVLPTTDSEGALAVGEEIRRALSLRALLHPRSRGGSLVTMSVGISTVVPTMDRSVEDLIAAADLALYAAKAAGRDRCTVGPETSKAS